MSDNRDTKYDKTVKSLKNNRIVIVLLLLVSITVALSQFIEAGKSIKETFLSKEILAIKEDTLQNDRVAEPIKSQSIHQLREVQSIISGRLIDKYGNGLPSGVIQTEDGEKTLTDESGYFEIKIRRRDQQLKIKLNYRKEGFASKERYVGIEQTNIILEL